MLTFMKLGEYGYVRVAAAVPRVHVANPMENAKELIALVREADGEGARVAVFPELSVTGYTCADLFGQSTLLRGAEEALGRIAEETCACDVLFAVGIPVAADNQLFNCAAVLHRGKVLAVIPKTFIPNYGEFYEKRWFAPSGERKSETVRLLGGDVPFGEDILLRCVGTDVVVAAEICEDLWMPIPPSSRHALRRERHPQPLGEQRRRDEGRLPPHADCAAVGAVHRRICVCLGGARRVDDGRRLFRAQPHRRKRAHRDRDGV